ncbi:MAG: ribonucleotide-diphosphate reductase subunit [Caudoviricetes sp.]|nr:MAG: ribonucleotide-diphosphate reductase subunit [Caudoviricetes sp.]
MTIEEWLGENNTLGIDIWHEQFQYNNETFDEWLDRVSGRDEKLKKLIKEKKFLFGGRTLANRGTNKKGSYSNCYTRGKIEDSLEDIMKANTDLALTYKAQGGQGLSLSNLRPKGCGINNGQYKSDGIIPFMKIYNETTKGVSQGGSRKGALIMSLDIWHKEAEDFIKIKSKKGEIEKANLSLEIDDEFMQCVEKYYSTGEIITNHIKREYEGNIVEYDVTPIDLYKLMIKTAYDWGEPGCLFTDQLYNYNLMEYVDSYNIESTNPCGEQPLPKHGACNLGSLNLSEFVRNPFTEIAEFDQDEFICAIKIAIRALDKALTENINNHPLPEQKEIAEKYRNIGLGIMGMHDMLIKLGLKYGSKESLDFMHDLMDLMFCTALDESSNIAEAVGPFPSYSNRVMNSQIIKNHIRKDSYIEKIKLRNCSLLSIAPTGTLASMLNISTGCEPMFRTEYDRKTEGLKAGEEKYYKVYPKVVEEYMNVHPGEKLPETFITADQINWKDRIDMQAVLQEHVDTAISSTVNLPNNIPLEEVEKLYLYAWQKGLKGITIFRDGGKRDGVLTHSETSSKPNSDFLYNSIKPVTREGLGLTSLGGRTYTKKIACGKLNITINHDENNKLLEVFVNTGKSGGCSANANCLGRYASTALRSGIRIEDIIDTTKGIKCSACANARGKGEILDGISCGDAIAKTIEEEYKRLNEVQEALNHVEVYEKMVKEINQPRLLNTSVCPNCGCSIIREGGCMVCKNCGWSKCS